MHLTIELIHTFLENGKMSVKVFRDNTAFINEVFANGRGLFREFSRALVQVPESIAYITQVTLKFINYVVG